LRLAQTVPIFMFRGATPQEAGHGGLARNNILIEPGWSRTGTLTDRSTDPILNFKRNI